MGSLLKPWVVRYLDGAGRQVRKGAPGARKVREKAKKWYGQYVDADGRRRRVPLATDKAAARAMLAKLEQDAQREGAGLISRAAIEHANRPIREHLADYETHLRNKGRAPRYIAEHLRRTQLVVQHCRAKVIRDIQPEGVESFLSLLVDRGTGHTMRNNYLLSAKMFLNWCVKAKRIGASPLAGMDMAKGEVRRERRALTREELLRLLAAARERPSQEMRKRRWGALKGTMVPAIRREETRARAERLGWERALIYKTLVYTGLRRGELTATEVRHLRLDGPRPCIVLPPGLTKNRKGANLPLRPDLVADLRAWIAATGKAGQDRVFRVPPKLIEILKADLEAAGIPYRDDEGRTVDVHAFRHTAATALGRANVNPRVAKDFMRHEDIQMTMQTYTDPRLLDEAEALDALPDLPLGGDAAEPTPKPSKRHQA